MTHLSAEEALDEYKAKLGPERGAFFKALLDDHATLRILFDIYANLFGTNPERVELLNSASGDLTFWIERCMFHEILLMICRLTDPAETHTNGKALTNITIRGLPRILSAGSDEHLAVLVQQAKTNSEFARNWRHKRIAHSDEQVRVSRLPLQPATRAGIRAAIDAIGACIRRWAVLEMDVTINTHPIRALGKDEIDFLKIVFRGQQEDLRIQEEMRAAKFPLWDAQNGLPEWLTVRQDQKFDIDPV